MPAIIRTEAAYLKLDCSKAMQRLNWRPILSLERALALTLEWYKAQQRGSDMRQVSLDQIRTVLSEGRATV